MRPVSCALQPLLRRAGVGAGTLALGVVGAGMAGLSGPQVARAGTPNDPIDLTTDQVTAIRCTSTHPSGIGVLGVGNDGGVDGQGSGTFGVRGYGVGSAIGVWGLSNNGPSIKAEKQGAAGVALVAEVTNADNSSSAIAGNTSGTGPGIDGYSQLGAGVRGGSVQGRGGVFQGAKAQIRLQPSTLSTKPATGQRGDLFVDKSGRLWYCKGGSTWKQIA